MKPTPTNLNETIKKITKPWTPVEVARFNDSVIRIARFEGEYHPRTSAKHGAGHGWHSHEKEDEVFIVWTGEIAIQLRNQVDLVLREGDICKIPRGVEHCPKADRPAYVLMIEPASLESGGN